MTTEEFLQGIVHDRKLWIGTLSFLGLTFGAGWKLKSLAAQLFIDRARVLKEQAEDALGKSEDKVAALQAEAVGWQAQLNDAMNSHEKTKKAMLEERSAHNASTRKLNAELVSLGRQILLVDERVKEVVGDGPRRTHDSSDPPFTILVTKRFQGHIQVHGSARCMMPNKTEVQDFNIIINAEPKE